MAGLMNIKSLIAGASLALALALPASAQLSGQLIKGAVNSTVTKNIAVDSSGRLLVVGSAAGNAVYGPDAVGAAPTQPPIYNGGQYQATTLPTCVTGAICNQQMDVSGNVRSRIVGTAGTASDAYTNTLAYTGLSNSIIGGNLLGVGPYVFNGTTWDRTRGNTSGAFVQGPNAAGGALTNPVPNGVNDSGVIRTAVGSNGYLEIQGNAASGATDAQKPVKVGGVYNSTLPTFTTGQRGDLQIGSRGSLSTQLVSADSTTPLGVFTSPGDASTATVATLPVRSVLQLWNSATYDRARSIQGHDNTGLGITATAPAPNSSVGSSITPAVSTALASGVVLKASAGNLYRITVTTSSVAGYLMVFNSTTVPADGAVTPLMCRAVGANTSLEVDHSVIPDRYTTGISAAFSTTGCFTKTASVTAMFEGSFQ